MVFSVYTIAPEYLYVHRHCADISKKHVNTGLRNKLSDRVYLKKYCKTHYYVSNMRPKSTILFVFESCCFRVAFSIHWLNSVANDGVNPLLRYRATLESGDRGCADIEMIARYSI